MRIPAHLAVAALVLAAGCSSAATASAPPKIPNAPFAAPIPYPAARASIAKHMLRAADFGATWYPAQTPAVTLLTNIPPGGISGARTFLTKDHKAADGWKPDGGIAELVLNFASPAAAHRYLTTTWLAIDRGGRAGFVIGTTAYALGFYGSRAVTSPTPRQIVRLAKHRANNPS
jgi:hypothetical protein